MNNTTLGPITSDKDFFSALRDDIPECAVCTELFLQGKTDDAREAFLSYVRAALQRDRFFEAIGFDPEATDAQTKKQAEDALDYNMVSCDFYHRFDGVVDWYSNPTHNGYEEWTWQLSRHRQILDLSQLYYSTRDEKYAIRAVELLYSWIKQAIVPAPDTDGHATLCWRTIECGIRMNNWAKIVLLLLDSPALTADFITDFFKSVCEHAERLSTRYTAANWLIIEMSGLHTLSALYPFFKNSSKWRELAKSIFIREMNEQTLSDGTHFELTYGYQHVALIGFSNVVKLARAFGDEFPADYMEKLRAHLHALVKVMMPSDYHPFVNDGKYLRIPEGLAQFLPLLPDDALLLWAVSRGKLGKAPDFTTAVLPYAGAVAFRSGWEKNSVAGYFDGGKFGRCHNHEDVIRCHQHEDKLNFLMYLGEKCVITEAGTYAYDTSKMRYYSLSSEGHNTAIVNGRGQNRLYNNHWESSMLTEREPLVYDEKDGVEFATASYNEGYGDAAATKATHTRTVYFVKSPAVGAPYFIVKDRLVASEPADFDLVWHYDTDELKISENRAVCTELTTFYSGDTGKARVIRGSEEPFAGWVARSALQGDYYPVPTVYYRVSGGECEVITAFVPNADGECPVSDLKYNDGRISVIYKNGDILKINL